jgi:hypothetical protein
MIIFSKTKDNRYRRFMKKHLAKKVERINNKLTTGFDGKLVQLGPNIFYFDMNRGIYFYINDEGIVEGAIHCSSCRDVVTIGLSVQHADAIKRYVLRDAIEGRGIVPLQTMEDSIPPELRDALGFKGPEKDEFTTANRWVIEK